MAADSGETSILEEADLRSGSRYESANSALNSMFLSGRFDGRPLYLTLANDMREDLAKLLGEPADHVEDCIAKIVGQSLDPHGDPFGSHLERLHTWCHAKEGTLPPFTAILFTLSYAASLMAADGDFGAGNYYDRLGAVMNVDAGRLRFNGASTEIFWREFNNWLTGNDFEFGRPTARQFNSWKYVNYPQSQAVVRAGDRKQFHKLFETYGLSGSEGLQIEEVKQYLAAWIHKSSVHNRLKAAWAKPELRDRVCEIALAELEDWDDGQAGRTEERGQASARLSLVAAFIPQFPKHRLDLRLGRPGDPVVGVQLSLPGSGFRAELANDTYGGLATLSPNPIAPHNRILETGIELEGNGFGAYWKPRLVVPMQKSQDGPYWIEVGRAKFATEHLLLVKDKASLKKDLESFLHRSSSGTYKLAKHDTLPGLPEGWLVYTDVTLLNVGGEIPKDLEALRPLSNNSGVMFEGGMRLTRGIWHAAKPPSVQAFAQEGGIQLQVLPSWVGDADPSLLSGEPRKVARLAAASIRELAGGEFTIQALVEGRVVSEAGLVLRSASKPRPFDRQGGGLLEYTNPVSAYRDTGGQSSGSQLLQGLTEVRPDVGTQSPKDSQDLPQGEAEDSVWGYTGTLINSAGTEGCVSSGYHHWMCDTPPEGSPKHTPVQMKCKHCALSVLSKASGKKKRGKRRRGKGKPISKPVALVPAAVMWEPSSAGAAKVDHDVFLDALCFLGKGKMARIETMLANSIEEPWQATRLVSNYSALGFLDVALTPGTGRVSEWNVRPPCVAFASPERAFLTGFRCEELVAEVEELVELAGGEVSHSSGADRPTSVHFSGLSPDDLQSALVGVTDPLGREVGVLVDAPVQISNSLASLRPIGDAFCVISVAANDADSWFNPTTGRWQEIREGDRPLVVRLGYAGSTYACRTRSGEWVSGPHQLVKLMAARQAGVKLHAYDPKARTFVSTLGAEPMGLLERALVLASGNLPTIAGGTSRYENVPQAVAETILSYLYEEPIFK